MSCPLDCAQTGCPNLQELFPTCSQRGAGATAALRLLPGWFRVIEQATGVQAGCGAASKARRC